MNKVLSWVKTEIEDYKILLRNVPSLSMALFVVSVITMNLLANREIAIPIPWVAADCGILVSWLSFLAMDMLTKRFGPKACIKISLVASGVNLLVCAIFFVVSKLPGNWGAFYTYENEIINEGLDSTIAGSWYVLFGSTVAFISSSVLNAILNAGIGKLTKSDSFGAYAARSYISTLLAQFADNFIFAIIVSYNFFGWSITQCVVCSAIGCVIELLCEVIFSPIGYKVSKSWEKHGVGQQYLEFAKNR